jgi:hypothetical protein
MKIIGIDQGSPEGDKTVIALKRDGLCHVCEVPEALGRITNLREQGGRIIADTESGTPMIVPVTF